MNTNRTAAPFARFPFTWLEMFIVRPGLAVDERRKRAFLILFLFTVLPILSAFALWHGWTKGLSYPFYLITLAIGVGVAVFVVLRYAQRTALTYRIGVLIILSLLISFSCWQVVKATVLRLSGSSFIRLRPFFFLVHVKDSFGW